MIRILHLYNDLMNLYGEYGNVAVLADRLKDLGIEVETVKKSLGDDICFSDYDFIYCGCGTEKNLRLALSDLKKRKSEFDEAVKKGSIILFTGNAMSLLGKKLDDEDALNYGSFSSLTSDKRYTGDVVVKNDIFGEVVGFINKCILIEGSKEESLFDYLYKANDEDAHVEDNEFEGFHQNNIYASFIIGPLLVKNPVVLRHFVSLLSNIKDFEYNYPYAEESYQVTLKALKERM